MPNSKKIDGIINSQFSIGKGTSKVDIRTNAGTIQARNNGGSFQDILGSTQIFTDTKEPTGFVNRTDSQISFNNSTRVLTIQPLSPATEYVVYYKGTRFVKTGTTTTTIGNVSGIWYIYFDSAGNIVNTQTVWDFGEVIPIAIVYWNATASIGYIGEERHGITMDSATHTYLHRTVGTRYASGLTMSGFTINTQSDAAVTFALSDGTIFDEDLRHNIVHAATPTNPFEQKLTDPARIPVFYRTGSAGLWNNYAISDFPYRNFPSGSLRLSYNQFTGGNWVETQCTSTWFVAYWIFATNLPNTPIISIQGQREDDNLTDAINNNTYESLNFGELPFQEFKLLYRVILQTASGYSGTTRSRILNVTDFRATSTVSSTSFVATNHATLTGLTAANAHPATAISTVTTNFNRKLNSADTDVQLALDDLDDHTHNVITAVAANYTVLTTDEVILVTTSTFDRTITLPAANTMTNRMLTIKKVDAGSGKVIIDANSTETIDGNLTIDLVPRYAYVGIVSDGTTWHITSGALLY